jgi:hypothetical protein
VWRRAASLLESKCGRHRTESRQLTIVRGSALAPPIIVSSIHCPIEEAHDDDESHKRHAAGMSDFSDPTENGSDGCNCVKNNVVRPDQQESAGAKGNGVAAGLLARFQTQDAESRLAMHTIMYSQALCSLYCACRAAGGVSQSGMSLFLLQSNVCHCITDSQRFCMSIYIHTFRNSTSCSA